MHLRAAHRFLNDPAVSVAQQKRLNAELGAFLLGNVAPDARVSGGMERADTHFFEYRPKITPPAQDAMLAAHPQLKTAQGAQRAFVAGYLAHLAMDVVWAEEMLFPYFYFKDWADQATRYVMLHVLLCYLDERDYRQWDEQGFAEALADAQPQGWAPFLSDTDLSAWQHIIATQIGAGCASQTIPILGARVTIGAAGLQSLLDNPARMQAELWQHVPPEAVAQVEARMYAEMLTTLLNYL